MGDTTHACHTHIVKGTREQRSLAVLFDTLIAAIMLGTGLALVAGPLRDGLSITFDVTTSVMILSTAALFYTAASVTILMPLEQSVSFSPREIATYFAIITLDSGPLIIAVVVYYVLDSIARPKVMAALLVDRSTVFAQVLVAEFVFNYFASFTHPVPALLVAGLISGLTTDALAIFGAAQRSRQWDIIFQAYLYQLTVLVQVGTAVIGIPLGYLVLRDPLVGTVSVMAVCAATFTAYKQYHAGARSMTIDKFDGATESSSLTPGEVLDELAAHVCTLGPMDRAHVRAVAKPSSEFDEADLWSYPCPQCSMDRTPMWRRLVVRTDDQYVLVVDFGSNAWSARRVSKTAIDAIRQLVVRAGTRWNAARLLEQANWNAEHDEGTGLGNIVLLREVLSRLASSKRYLALLRCETLDDVRTTSGREAEVVIIEALAESVRNISANNPDVDSFRIGDATFALVMPADLAQVVLEEFNTSHLPSLAFSGWQSRFAVGFVDADSSATPDEIMRRAHVALIAAERSEDTDLVWYDEDLENDTAERARMRHALKQAIDDNKLRVALQPQVNSVTGQVVGFEALARWIDDDLGFIPPSVFIPLAQESRLMPQLTLVILRQALESCVAWQSYLPGVGVSVNMSSSSVIDPSFAHDLECLIVETGARPELLTLELTESVIMENTGEGAARLQAFRAQGYEVSLDDFGTGYSSLAMLKDLPVDEVKIDRSFVVAGSQSQDGFGVLSHIVSLMMHLHKRIVVEGVEDQATVEMLQTIDCPVVQGYVYAKPMPPAEIASWLQEHSLTGTAPT